MPLKGYDCSNFKKIYMKQKSKAGIAHIFIIERQTYVCRYY